MSHPARLSGLPLSTGNKAKPFSMIPIGHSVAAPPKLGRDAMVNDITEHMSPLAVFDEPKGVTTKLKVVPPLIDAKRIMPPLYRYRA